MGSPLKQGDVFGIYKNYEKVTLFINGKQLDTLLLHCKNSNAPDFVFAVSIEKTENENEKIEKTENENEKIENEKIENVNEKIEKIGKKKLIINLLKFKKQNFCFDERFCGFGLKITKNGKQVKSVQSEWCTSFDPSSIWKSCRTDALVTELKSRMKFRINRFDPNLTENRFKIMIGIVSNLKSNWKGRESPDIQEWLTGNAVITPKVNFFIFVNFFFFLPVGDLRCSRIKDESNFKDTPQV